MAEIAYLELVAVRPTGERTPVKIRVSQPVWEDAEEWSCLLALDGLHANLAAMRGADALQALCLALGLGAALLRHFTTSGGRLEFPSGEEFPLEAYFGSFGPAAAGA